MEDTRVFHHVRPRVNEATSFNILFRVLDMAALGLVMYCMQYYLVLSWGIPEMAIVDVK